MLTGGMIGMKDRGIPLYPFGAYGYTDPVFKMFGKYANSTSQKALLDFIITLFSSFSSLSL